jgi:hypothetical protein|tara:strand:- start:242 stop:1423 length:1182 start_codon:yes stop_codon:yes gene_type:complete
MPITDQLANAVDPTILPGVQNNVSSESPLVNVLLRFARFKRGAAGDGIRIQQLIDQNAGRFYSDFDAATREFTDKNIAHFEQWVNGQWDRVLAGTRLESVLGRTSKSIIAADNINALPGDARDAILDIVGQETEGAGIAGANDVARTFHGTILATDNTSRLTISSDDIFSETGALHGLGITGLGDWPAGRHPWNANPPNTAGSINRHIAQRFDNSGAGNRTISKAVLSPAIIQMMAQVQGFWVCGLAPALYDTLSSEWDAQFDLTMGIGTVEFTVAAVRLLNCYYFPDSWVPTDTARHYHIGNPSNGMGGSIYPFFWDSGSSMANPVEAGVFNAGPSAVPGVRLGRPFPVPYYTQEWTRDGTSADAISSELQLKYMWVCAQRWKQFEVAELQA